MPQLKVVAVNLAKGIGTPTRGTLSEEGCGGGTTMGASRLEDRSAGLPSHLAYMGLISCPKNTRIYFSSFLFC